MHLFTVFKFNSTVTAYGTHFYKILGSGRQFRFPQFGNFISVKHLNKCHTVLGKRARFVRTDYRRTAERLNRRKFFYDSVLFYHTLNTERQYNGYYRRQPFGDCGNGKRYRSYKKFYKFFSPGHTVLERWAESKFNNTDYKNYRTDYKRKYAQSFAQVRQPVFKRCCSFARRFNKGCDFAHFGIHTYFGNDSLSAAVGNRAARIDHIKTVAYRGNIRYFGAVDYFFNRNRFARKGRFIAPQRMGFDKACVGRDVVPCFKKNKVTGDKFACRHYLYGAAAYDFSRGRRHIFKRFQSIFRLGFLINSERRINKYNRYNNYRFYPVILA